MKNGLLGRLGAFKPLSPATFHSPYCIYWNLLSKTFQCPVLQYPTLQSERYLNYFKVRLCFHDHLSWKFRHGCSHFLPTVKVYKEIRLHFSKMYVVFYISGSFLCCLKPQRIALDTQWISIYEVNSELEFSGSSCLLDLKMSSIM